MVYIAETTDTQVIRIPRSIEGLQGEIKLTLRNNTERKATPVLALCTDTGISQYYYLLDVVFQKKPKKGEYEYTLTIGNDVASNGLVIVGDYGTGNKTYVNNTTYEQYNG